MSELLPSWTTAPFNRVASDSAPGSAMASAVTSHGPSAPEPGKFLPGVNWALWRCQSRTEPSLKQA